jgi:hypothetical protein
VDPRTYCQQAIAELRRKPTRRGAVGRPQLLVVLAHFARLAPSEPDFARQLQQLAEAAERRGRYALAEAARVVLGDWQARRG